MILTAAEVGREKKAAILVAGVSQSRQSLQEGLNYVTQL